MPHYFLKLCPPRPTFAFDMNADEAALMGQHAAYWTARMREAGVVVFGPVMDPNGPFGLGVAEFADEDAAKAFAGADPAIKADCGFFYEIHQMQAVTRDGIAV